MFRFTFKDIVILILSIIWDVITAFPKQIREDYRKLTGEDRKDVRYLIWIFGIWFVIMIIFPFVMAYFAENK